MSENPTKITEKLADRSASGCPVVPTYYGHCVTTTDALILIEACLLGELSHVPRRPHDRERPTAIASGNIFIYEEHSSGIKRWTDGVTWSPSRILGNFLLYRELEQPFQPGEKKRAMKRTRDGQPKTDNAGSAGDTEGTLTTVTGGSSGSSAAQLKPSSNSPPGDPDIDPKVRPLIGSLVDSYNFKEGGLVKKTISVSVRGVMHHLVSYYSVEDGLSGNLPIPSRVPALAQIVPRPELMASNQFRNPIEDLEMFVKTEDAPLYMPSFVSGVPPALPPALPHTLAPTMPPTVPDSTLINTRSMSVPSVQAYPQTWNANSPYPQLGSTSTTYSLPVSTSGVFDGFAVDSIAPWTETTDNEASQAHNNGHGSQAHNGYSPQPHNGYGSQVQNGCGSPSPTGYGSQVQNGYGSQVQNGYGSQAHSGYGSQVHSGYGSQAHNRYGSPAHNRYNSTAACYATRLPDARRSYLRRHSAMPGAMPGGSSNTPANGSHAGIQNMGFNERLVMNNNMFSGQNHGLPSGSLSQTYPSSTAIADHTSGLDRLGGYFPSAPAGDTGSFGSHMNNTTQRRSTTIGNYDTSSADAPSAHYLTASGDTTPGELGVDQSGESSNTPEDIHWGSTSFFSGRN